MPGPLYRDGQGCPVRWSGRQAVAVLPGQLDSVSVGPVREQLLTVINRGATVLVVDMSATFSCDYAGADALARVYRRAVANGTVLRLVIGAPAVRRVIALSGLDRLVPVFGTLAAAQAAQPLAAVLALPPRAEVTGSATVAPPGGAGRVSRLPVCSPASPSAPRGMQRHEFDQVLTYITGGIFHAGLTLQTALDQHPDALRRAAERALELLDATVCDARAAAFARYAHGPDGLADAGDSGAAVQPGVEARSGSLSAGGEDIVRLSRLRASEATRLRARSRKARARSANLRAHTLQAAARSAATQHQVAASVSRATASRGAPDVATGTR